jgi:hypothetical protein
VCAVQELKVLAMLTSSERRCFWGVYVAIVIIGSRMCVFGPCAAAVAASAPPPPPRRAGKSEVGGREDSRDATPVVCVCGVSISRSVQTCEDEVRPRRRRRKVFPAEKAAAATREKEMRRPSLQTDTDARYRSIV